ncbi:phosphatase PAP2 family protein [Streptococcus macedonicus]|uniref:Phosphatase PAP2 family protein n=1 Tax=Streptococcus macedonicus TaxID=59310 RepID=A0AA47FBR4_STRMC|nr:phosphatase PAP2 family protein [Streptococcus macedonicus]MCW8486360.1 phosphatase PAP2 family protein [Streptococcus macedonicus]MCW8494488.1 phosphatase PAP2 family protein [Streptococcus macedonicus]MCW8499841.1 phosphatase PAP2 family protein [Streptococcus macedonicus]MCW8501817.1 phosphatase PAP2 family protein [Streptococcus macedonicus]MCW8503935.1 phosphatase PAP2 family protein [Streptococcus macedonicus]
MKNYATFYNKLTRSFQNKPTATRCLQVVNSLLTKIMYLIYPLMLIYLFCIQSNRLLAFILIPALSFMLVSVVRKLLNVPRPYETWNITPLISKDTKGHSFPSRHVFSASIISMAVLTQSSFLGVILLILSLVIAFCRVLGGVHYPHDVVAGYLIGLICGFLLFLF